MINRRPSGRLGKRFRGVTAANCRVSFEFVREGVAVLGPIDARWSGAPEPESQRDFPESYRWDLAATGTPEQIAIARTDGGKAYAFSAKSYLHNWQKPGWELDPGAYDVVMRLASTEAEASHTFRLVVAASGVLALGEMP